VLASSRRIAYEYPPNRRRVELVISLLPGELCVRHATENSEVWPFPSPHLLWRRNPAAVVLARRPIMDVAGCVCRLPHNHCGRPASATIALTFVIRVEQELLLHTYSEDGTKMDLLKKKTIVSPADDCESFNGDNGAEKYALGRRFFVTEKQYFGLAPSQVVR
jgi:hypothetical protein